MLFWNKPFLLQEVSRLVVVTFEIYKNEILELLFFETTSVLYVRMQLKIEL